MADDKPTQTEDKTEEPKQPEQPSNQTEQPDQNTQQVNPLDSITAELAALKQSQSDMMAAISALANQGAVNASVAQDNGNGEDAESYPTIDLTEINRLIGA